ncbi:MAG: TlpA family protein disulfide reductase [Breznakibacter sp.]
MKKFALSFLFIVVGLGSWAQQPQIPMVNFSGLEPMLHKQTDTVYVVNFWATWCKPCVEELPHFLETAHEYKAQKVKFLFVSLDFPKQAETKLVPFVAEKMEGQAVILLNDPAANSWIDKVSSDWSGAIPATLVYRGTSRSFTEGTLSKTELTELIKSKL